MSNLLEKYKDVPYISFYVNDKNIGMSGNWNRCLMLSKGKWTAYLHDDDLLKDNYVCEITKILTDSRYSDAGAFCLQRDALIQYTHSSSSNSSSGVMPAAKKSGIFRRALKYALRKSKTLFLKMIDILISFRYLYRRNIREITAYQSLYVFHVFNNIYGAPSFGNVFSREKLLADGGWCEEGYPAHDRYTYMKFNESNKVYAVNMNLGVYRLSVNTLLKTPQKEWAYTYLGLLKHKWKTEKINMMLKRESEMRIYCSVSALAAHLTDEDAEEVCRSFGFRFIKPSRLRIEWFYLKCRLYYLLHNLDWRIM